VSQHRRVWVVGYILPAARCGTPAKIPRKASWVIIIIGSSEGRAGSNIPACRQNSHHLQQHHYLLSKIPHGAVGNNPVGSWRLGIHSSLCGLEVLPGGDVPGTCSRVRRQELRVFETIYLKISTREFLTGFI
jgi:hypothetical protein